MLQKISPTYAATQDIGKINFFHYDKSTHQINGKFSWTKLTSWWHFL